MQLRNRNIFMCELFEFMNFHGNVLFATFVPSFNRCYEFGKIWISMRKLLNLLHECLWIFCDNFPEPSEFQNNLLLPEVNVGFQLRSCVELGLWTLGLSLGWACGPDGFCWLGLGWGPELIQAQSTEVAHAQAASASPLSLRSSLGLRPGKET